MLSSDESVSDLFFDSVDRFPFEETIATEEELGCSTIAYDLWLKEPKSVEERRQSFLQGMGFIGSERITECSGAACISSVSCVDKEEGDLIRCGRELSSEANSMVDEMELNRLERLACENENPGRSLSLEVTPNSEGEENDCYVMGKKTKKSWWKNIVNRKKKRDNTCLSKPDTNTHQINRMKVKQNRKSCMEFTGVYLGQEIQAHKGFIWTMKFSPGGQYLATGGEDGIVRIWRVTSVDSSCMSFTSESHFGGYSKESKSSFGSKKMSRVPVVIPEKVFQIEESPIHEFRGHAGDVLDLAWSNTNHLLSSSKDKTVRLWQVGCNRCLNVFRHSDFVTCIQFNPEDENYFISGSIDGKVRIWGVTEERVVDWADMRDVISAICYHPDGKGFVVGTVSGACRFYDASGIDLQLEAELQIHGRKRLGNKITGIQFSQDRAQRVLIASEDSKIRIFEGIDIIKKFKALPKSGSQMSASFTSTGRHIVSVGEDSRVYVWNYDGLCIPSSKHIKSLRSCEHFYSEGVSVAVPWSGMATEPRSLGSSRRRKSAQTEEGAASCRRDSERFSLHNWLFMDGPCRGASATWPEEKLPLWDEPITGDYGCQNQIQDDFQDQLIEGNDQIAPSEAWGLVIVTAGWDGILRTFHNYGLPIRT